MNDEQRAALARPFSGEMVRQKKGQGGRLMDYVSHGGVTKRLNDAAPDWTAVMVERWIVGDGDKLHCLGGVMQLTIGGVMREEAGGPTRLATLADDLKNTYSDCLKRCAMRFGVALDMWESAEEDDEDAQGFPTAPDARTADARSSASTTARDRPARAGSDPESAPAPPGQAEPPAPAPQAVPAGKVADWATADLLAYANDERKPEVKRKAAFGHYLARIGATEGDFGVVRACERMKALHPEDVATLRDEARKALRQPASIAG